MSLIFLIIGTALTAIFVLLLVAGQKYNDIVDALEGDDFPLKEIYTAGIALQNIPIFRARGKIGDFLREKTKLIYTRKYSEYYTTVIWGQAISMGMFCCALCFLIAGLIPDMAMIMGLFGVVMAIMPGYYFINHLGEVVATRQTACEEEFPNVISKLALLVNSGVILHEAWEIVAEGNEGTFYDLMRVSCMEMQNGKSDIDAIHDFGVQTNSDIIKKFTSALIQSIERGGGEISLFLSNQSKEIWAHRRQVMLQKGEKAAGALLMPIALMFFGVMMIVIAAAMQSFGL